MLVLHDGTLVRIRPIGPADRDGVADLFARLSPESRRRRFLVPKSRLTQRELAYLTDIDHVGHAALAAVDVPTGRLIGVCRYATWDGSENAAEVAVAVDDAMHGRGIGRCLATRIIEHARRVGIARLTASTHADNKPALALLARLGFRLQATGPVLEFQRDL
jgi:RimJ/RimL family protein N-acetyltransferase